MARTRGRRTCETLASDPGQADQTGSAGGCQKTWARPTDRFARQPERRQPNRRSGRTQAPDPTPVLSQDQGSRAGSTTHTLPAESAFPKKLSTAALPRRITTSSGPCSQLLSDRLEVAYVSVVDSSFLANDTCQLLCLVANAPGEIRLVRQGPRGGRLAGADLLGHYRGERSWRRGTPRPAGRGQPTHWAHVTGGRDGDTFAECRVTRLLAAFSSRIADLS